MPVAARHHELRDRVIAAVDRKFAEPVKLFPMRGGRTDPGRAVMTFEGVLRVGEGKETNPGGGAARSWRSRLSAGKAELHIDRATYAGPPIAKGDKIEGIARIGGPTWEVLTVDDRSHTRLVLELGEV